jgi:hypothetical protein
MAGLLVQLDALQNEMDKHVGKLLLGGSNATEERQLSAGGFRRLHGRIQRTSSEKTVHFTPGANVKTPAYLDPASSTVTAVRPETPENETNLANLKDRNVKKSIAKRLLQTVAMFDR